MGRGWGTWLQRQDPKACGCRLWEGTHEREGAAMRTARFPEKGVANSCRFWELPVQVLP